MGDSAAKTEVVYGMKQANELLSKIKDFLTKYKYPALILLAGIVLMIIPTKKKTVDPVGASGTSASLTTAEAGTDINERVYCAQTEKRLEQILSQIEGAGAVRVMLTLQAGPQTNYLADQDMQRTTEGEKIAESSESKTVILSRGSSYNEAAIVKTEYPSFRGALVVSQGGDDASVRLRLVEAVSALLGLGTDKITVVKMK